MLVPLVNAPKLCRHIATGHDADARSDGLMGTGWLSVGGVTVPAVIDLGIPTSGDRRRDQDGDSGDFYHVPVVSRRCPKQFFSG